MDRLISENRDGEDTSYLYDLCGNRLKKLDKNGKEEYNYNRKNQLISRERGGQRVMYQYNTQGNLLEAAGAEGSTRFSYNAFNQQTEVLAVDGERLENQYDAEYLRAGTIENGEKRTFLYYQGELIAEADKSEEPISRYILGYGVAAGWNQGREEYYSYHLDEQNSTVYITGMGGKIENVYQYDAFGVIRKSQERIRNRILYTGQQYDQISGQYYLRARYYNPVVGRFLQEDVYRGDGLNLYAYCENNPVGYYDDEGNVKKKIKPGAQGGAYNQIEAAGGEIHHMPADSASPYGTGSGPGIRMLPEDHKQTKSWGFSKKAQEYQQKQKDLIAQGKFKEAQRMDIEDVQSKFPKKYDIAIKEMEEYTDELLRKRPIKEELKKNEKRRLRKQNLKNQEKTEDTCKS